jgi:hypothetical protein
LRTSFYQRIEPYLSGLLLLGCVALWIHNYAAGRSLFLDEANLALNIGERRGSAFFRHLAYEQYAPPVFLLLVKAATALVGYSVWGLRLVPLLAGCGTLWLGWRLPARLDLGLLRPLLFGLLLANEYTLRYFTECKQYGFDILVTTGLLYLALAQPARLTRRWAGIWLLAGTLAVWSSMPSVFVLAAIGSRAVWANRREKSSMLPWLLIGAFWLGHFLLYYLLLLRADTMRPDLADWHRPYFFPLLPQSLEDWTRIGTLLRSIVRTGFGHTVFAQSVATLSGLAGVGYLLTQRRQLAWYTLVPLGLALLASGLGQYSLLPRLLLFALPLLWMIALAGTDFLIHRLGRYGAIAAFICWALALAGTRNPVRTTVRYDATRELLTALELQPTVTTYVTHTAAPATRYYQEWHPPTAGWLAALAEQPLRYGNDSRSALRQLLDDRPAVAELLHTHPNPELARQYLLTARRKLSAAGYTVRITRQAYNGWIVHATR